ncbi:MAG: hypothetical protein DIZ78_09390 [endosymbiont of Escarpia spicata]|uniref:Uncharacterized protein n=1 Tax=endosymbiont of Escarpia spicata TaxID=2200908 RepID=A0A370DNG3_9GAMM|nr:MAG: hypothetical protein DIZ78_09390 [endosymbiont of Escarpia spicata]
MPVDASEIIVYGSASMPDDDTPTNIGGAIDITVRVVFTDIAATDQVEIVSDAAGDTTQTVTIHGRNAAGELISDAMSLNGTTVVLSTETFERILKIVVSAAHTGTITVRDQDTDTTIASIESGVLEIRRPFYNAAAEASGGAERKYYEKVFFKNTDPVLSLTGATISEQADPSGNVAFALETTLDGTDTNGVGNDRQTAPATYTFDSTTKNVANSQNHTAGAGQGVWLELTLAAGAAATNTTVTPRESGTTV